MPGTIILVVLVLLLLGALPNWPYSASWGYAPSVSPGGVLVAVLILVLLNKIWSFSRLGKSNVLNVMRALSKRQKIRFTENKNDDERGASSANRILDRWYPHPDHAPITQLHRSDLPDRFRNPRSRAIQMIQ